MANSHLGSRILWFTSRDMTDLCSTTTRELANGLTSKGYDLTVLGPGIEGELGFKHITVKRSSRRGFRASSLAKNILQKLKNQDIERFSAAIVDWPLATKLEPYFTSNNIPWVLIDRSPPADRGLLAKLQWKIWKSAWDLVKTGENIGGCVVSTAHAELVSNKTGINISSIGVIPAGVNLEKFSHVNRDEKEKLKLVYHGQIDRHRGVANMPKLHLELQKIGIESELMIVGDGDYFSTLKSQYKDVENIHIMYKLPQNQLSEILSSSDIGLLPMPDQGVWNIASPLKRSEYIASGLIVLGVDHKGHHIDGNQPWLKLVSESDFVNDGATWIKQISEKKSMPQLAKEARQYAEINLSWKHSVEALESQISKILQ